jgi:hypothetical protein
MSKTFSYPDILPIPELAEWTERLSTTASQPLTYCPDFPKITQRYEAWWRQELTGHPIFMASANKNPARPIRRRLSLLDDPEAWYAAKVEDLNQQHRVGDTIPTIRADFGAVLQGGLYGGLRESSADTSWTHPFIDDDWSNTPNWRLPDPENEWWIRMQTLLSRAAEDAAGNYVVCTPDLGSSADTLITLRGSTSLAYDMVDRPETIHAAVDEMYFGWRQAFMELYRQTVDLGAPMIHFFGLWSSQPYALMACDFNALIGPKHFEEMFLPDIARQSETAERAFFHLDGPGAAKHIDSLLTVPGLQAIQFTPGAGYPSAMDWVDMFRKIQESGRSVLAICPADEVLDLCDALDPADLAIVIDDPLTPAQLDDLYDTFCWRFE